MRSRLVVTLALLVAIGCNRGPTKPDGNGEARPPDAPADSVEYKAVHRFKAHERRVQCVAFSQDGKTLATCGGDKLVKLWEVSAGKEVKAFEGHKDEVDSVVVTPDGQTAVSVCKNDSTLRIWDRKSGKEKHKLEVLPTTRLDLSPDGKTAVTGTILDLDILLIDIAGGKEVGRLKGEKTNAWSVAWATKAPRLATGGSSPQITLWDPVRKKELEKINIGNDKGVSNLALSPDGKTLVWWSDEHLAGWDVAQKKQLYKRKHDGLDRLVFHPGGQFVATDAKVKIVSAATGEVKGWVAEDPSRTGVEAVAFSPDGKWLAVGSNDGSVRLVDTSSLK